MPRFFLNCLICHILLMPAQVGATSRLYDADAVVTLRNGNPCFSFPPNGEKLFGYHLTVSNPGPRGAIVWDIQIFDYEKKKLPEPNSQETCIEYGVVNSDIEVRRVADPLLPDTPYRVFISVAEAPTGGQRYRYLRKLASDFCISKNEKGDAIIVAAAGGDTGAWRCLKPGESPKRGFWQRLFGK